MDLSIEGQMEIKEVIYPRLTPELVNKVASMLSSNCCENYLGVLMAFSQGNAVIRVKLIAGVYYKHLLQAYAVMKILLMKYIRPLVYHQNDYVFTKEKPLYITNNIINKELIVRKRHKKDV